MYNLDFLNEGEIFPPLEEAKRIGSYYDYDLLFDGNSYAVEERHYKQTLNNLNRIAILLGWTESYIGIEYNYYKLITTKTADFVCGEYPDILASNVNEEIRKKEQAVIDKILRQTKFYEKQYDAFIDVSKYGNSYLRIYNRESLGNFSIQSPAMLIRVVDEEDQYYIKNYVVAWFIENGKKLKVQIHDKNGYFERTYDCRPILETDVIDHYAQFESANVNNSKSSLYTLIRDRWTGEIFRYVGVKLGKFTETRKNLPFNDFAIVELSNVKNSEKTYGVSDYSAIESVIANIQRTMTQVQMLFDKYTTPTAYGAPEIVENVGAESVFEIGRFWGIPPDGTIPAFLEPDLTKLQQYFTQLQFNIDRLKELSEMGAVISSDVSVSNISTETMKAQFTAALKKAERLTTRNEDAIRHTIHLISMIGYDMKVPEDDIVIKWYDGLPNDEQKDVNIASSMIQAGLSSRKEQYINRFNHTDEQWEDMWTQLNDENTMISSISSIFNPPAPDNSNNSNSDDNTENDEENGTQDGNTDESEE